jgi:hypothetical protein
VRLNEGIHISRRPAKRYEPLSVLETRQFPTTILLKKWCSTGKGRLVISRLGRRTEPGKHPFGVGVVASEPFVVDDPSSDWCGPYAVEVKDIEILPRPVNLQEAQPTVHRLAILASTPTQHAGSERCCWRVPFILAGQPNRTQFALPRNRLSGKAAEGIREECGHRKGTLRPTQQSGV